MKNSLVKVLFERINKNKKALSFIKKISKDNELFLFGGGVRDYIENNLTEIRDLDFVVKSKLSQTTDIEKYMPKNVNFTKNRFDGYKITFDDLVIDIWDINNTWAFKNHKLNISVNNLLNSVYLNIDSLLYSINEDKYVNNCEKKYETIKNLDVVCDDTPCESLNLLRALVFKRKYSLDFSNKLKNKFYFYINNNKTNVVQDLMTLQKEHYHYYIIPRNDIKKELQKLGS